MNKPIAKWLMSQVFPKKTVTSVLSQFEKVVQDLNEIQATGMSDAADKRKEADRLIDEAKRHEAEASRAVAVANKINSLISST